MESQPEEIGVSTPTQGPSSSGIGSCTSIPGNPNRPSNYHSDPGAGNSSSSGIIWWFFLVWFMVFNATFNNISVISWQSVLLVEETGGPGENQQPAASHWQTLLHNVVWSTSCHERGSNSQL